jgi:hypothetical protein
MNLEDESYLSAYLDGELDEEQRLQVESALRSNPRLAEHVQDLAAVRDLVSGLARPTLSLDLSRAFSVPTVTHPHSRSIRFLPLVRGGLGLAAAAAVLVALIPILRPKPRPQNLAIHSGPSVAKVAAATGKALSSASREKVEPMASAAPEQPPAAPRPASPPVAIARTGEETEPARATDPDHDPQHIRDYLDSPRLHRVFFVTDVLGGDAGDRVNALVQRTPRTEPVYGRISVGPEIVIDPKHPNKAEVFALMLRDDELPRFKLRLTQAFPDAVEEADPDPIVITQLSEIGQLAVLTDPADPAVVFPETPATIALRDSRKDQPRPLLKNPIVLDPADLNSSDPFAQARVREMIRGPSNVQENPTPEQERSGRFPTRSLPTPNETPPAVVDAGRSSIVLVWVTTGETR